LRAVCRDYDYLFAARTRGDPAVTFLETGDPACQTVRSHRHGALRQRWRYFLRLHDPPR
jgi:hypothetical protein